MTNHNPLRQWQHRSLICVAFALAVFNLFYHLGTNRIEKWDEARRGVAAFEMMSSSNWAVHTYLGTPDLWSVKPPLGLWVMTLSYKLLGPSIWSLRLPSAIAALLTIFLTALIGSRTWNKTTGILSALILATTYPFICDHCGRAGEYDALLVLLITAAVYTVLFIDTVRWRTLLLGVLLGAIFLLKSFVVIIPLLVVTFGLSRLGNRSQVVLELIAIGIISTIVIAPWALARYAFDGTRFFEAMVHTDLLSRTVTAIEGHDHSMFYPLIRVLKESAWWSVAAFILLVMRFSRYGFTGQLPSTVVAWATVPLVVATLIQTKVSWYILPAYPALALLLAALIYSIMSYRFTLVAILGITALTIGEVRIVRKIEKRDEIPPNQTELRNSTEPRGRTVYRESWSQDELFIAIVEKGYLPVESKPKR